ncbi:MAG: hypothetical protein J3K34DRAFT_406666 [Monoraphidium minutum]|nr:MAG: hypothetical protein J3K34DRAFT_406666 [Monoraphidium minutum]
MQDPVILVESGHSFERMALKDWWASGHRMCPKSGVPLKAGKLQMVSNLQLREAIQRWSERGEVRGPAAKDAPLGERLAAHRGF